MSDITARSLPICKKPLNEGTLSVADKPARRGAGLCGRSGTVTGSAGPETLPQSASTNWLEFRLIAMSMRHSRRASLPPLLRMPSPQPVETIPSSRSPKPISMRLTGATKKPILNCTQSFSPSFGDVMATIWTVFLGARQNCGPNW